MTGRARRRARGGGRWLSWRTVLAVAARPALWRTALVQAVRLAPRGWWRRPPHLPRPDPAYLRFRAQTYSGDPEEPPGPAAIVAYLEWCKGMGRLAR
jgi:hypothetical protein